MALALSISELAGSPYPAWLWDYERLRIVWANEAGVRFWHGDSLFDLLDRRFGPLEPGIEKLGQLARNLKPDERRTLKVSFPSLGADAPAECHCMRYQLADGRDGLLVTVAPQGDIAAAAEPGLSPQLLGALPMPVGIFDSDGAARFVNPAAGELFDCSPAAPEAFSLAAALGDSEIAEGMIARVRAAGTISETRRARTRYGERVHLLTIRQITDPESQGDLFLVLFDDVTERRAYERRLTETTARLEDFVRATGGFTWEMNDKLQLMGVSDDFVSLTGVAAEHVVGKSWSELAQEFDLEGLDSFEYLLDSHRAWRGTLTWPGAEGALVLLISAVPVRAADGAFAGYRGVGIDRPAARGDIPASDASKTTPREKPKAAPAPVAPSPAGPPASAKDATPGDPVAGNVTVLRAASNERAFLDDGEARAFRTIAEQLGDDAQNAGPADGAAKVSQENETLMLDASDVAVLVHRDFKLHYANAAAADLLGFSSRETLLSDHTLLTLFPADRAELIALGDGAAASIPKSLALTHIDANGKERSLSALATSGLWQGHDAIRIFLSASPEQAAGDRPADARSSENAADDDAGHDTGTSTLEAIVDLAGDGIAILDGDGRVETLNARARTLLGLEGPLPDGLTLKQLAAPQSADKLDRYLAGFAQETEPALVDEGCEIEAKARDGETPTLLLTLGRLPAGAGDARFCAIMRDVSGWRQTETELRRAKEIAEQANAQKSDFLAKISHELRTPLNAIIGFSEVMAGEKFGAIGNKRYQGYVNDIHSSGEHLLSLINDLLDLSKIEAGKFELNFASVDLDKIIRETVATMQPEAAQARVIIRMSVTPELPPVVADQRSMRQIMLNLMSNAVKFTDPGGQVIVSAALDDGGALKLKVRDTGIGMSDEELVRALEPFRQIERRDRDERVGTGLGLPLTKALVEANRASFDIESTPDEGTLVQITFPTPRVLAD